MSVQVTVALDDDGLVAIKRATTNAEVERLQGEAFRLRRAGHPGVVCLVGHRRVLGGEELRLRYAGDPVERWRGTPAQAAGLGAAVAATLADLHDLGLVHGRLDATHVLVGADGRPRLCGLSDPGDATSADDVAAVGRLLHELLANASEPRKGPFGWSVGGGADRRALARVLARALDPEPTRRPSARVLATSILRAVDGAELPPRTGENPAAGVPPSPPPAPAPLPASPPPPPSPATAPDAEEEAWRLGTAGVRDDADEGPDDWVRLLADPSLGFDLLPTPNEVDEAHGERKPSALDAWLAWSTSAGLERPSPGSEGADAGAARPRTAAITGPVPLPRLGDAPPRHPTLDARGAGTHADPATAVRHARAAGDPAPAGDGAAHDHHGAVGHARDSAAHDHHGAVGHAGDRPAHGQDEIDGEDAWHAGATGQDDHEAQAGEDEVNEGGTWNWAPARVWEHRDGAAKANGRRTARVMAGLGVAGLVGVGIAAAALGVVGGPGDAGGTAHGGTGNAPSRAACARVHPPAADVDGDGCPEALTVEGNRVSAGEATWRLGRTGDVVAVGDWDCDGSATSALLRPGTGDVFLFTGWSATGEPVTVTPARSVPGGVALRVERRTGGCDALVVESADGAGTVVGEARA